MESNHFNRINISLSLCLPVSSSTLHSPTTWTHKGESIIQHGIENENRLLQIWQLGLICRETTEILHQHEYKWRQRGRERETTIKDRGSERQEMGDRGGKFGSLRQLYCKNAFSVNHPTPNDNNSTHCLVYSSSQAASLEENNQENKFLNSKNVN